MVGEELKIEDLKPLGLKCSQSDCKTGRHYFALTKKVRQGNDPLVCKDCKADLVEWDRVRKRDLIDVENTFNSLRYEYIRHVYWHCKFDQRAINYALRKGKIELFAAAEHRIRKYIAKPEDAFSSMSTSYEGNPIFYAQHATATCCRKCIEKWHDIPCDKLLTEAQILYFTKLITLYLDERFPNLPDHKQKVASIRNKNNH